MNIDHSGDSSEWGFQLFLYFCIIIHGLSLGHLIHSLFTKCDCFVFIKLAATIAGCNCCYHFYLSEYSSVMKLVCYLVSGFFGLIIKGEMNDYEVAEFDKLALFVQICSFILKLKA